MTTWADMRTKVRRVIQDENSTKWPDEEMLDYINDALDAFAKAFPRIRTYTESVSVGASTITLDEDTLGVDRVFWSPTRLYLTALDPTPGKVFREDIGLVSHYSVEGQTLTLLDVPQVEGDLKITVREMYPQITVETDTIPVPRIGHRALELYVQYCAMMREELADAQLSRFASTLEKGGDRRDNPLLPATKALYEAYLTEINALLSTQHLQLNPGWSHGGYR